MISMELFLNLLCFTSMCLGVNCLGQFISNKMSVNMVPLYTNITGTKEVGLYRYEDGYQTIFTCRKDIKGYLKMTYIPQGAELNMLTEYQPTDTLDWYMKLTSENHNGILQCEIADVDKAIQHVINVRLENIAMAPESGPHTQVLPGFKVNGLKLSVMNSKQDTNEVYKYEYECYKNELNVTINIMMNFEKYEHLSCRYLGPNSEINERQILFKDTYTFTKKFEERCEESVLSCTVQIKNQSARKDFSLKFIDNAEVPVSGLSFANIIMRYVEINDKYDYRVKIVYDYNYSELTCNGYNWMNGENDKVTCIKKPKSKACTFKITNNPLTVTCSSYDLRLVGKKQVPPAPNTEQHQIVPSLIIVGVLVIVTLIAVTILLHFYRRRKSQTRQVLMDYSTLPEHNEGPMASPRQWNEERTDLYAKPIPKSQRNKNQSTSNDNEPTYAEPSYAVVGNLGEDNYASLDMVYTSSRAEIVESVPYAIVASPGDRRQHSVHNDANYSNCQINNNVTHSGYVNVNSPEMFEEPAYCQVNKCGK